MGEELPLVANPADILDWNTDKRYLADLVRAGVPVIPTSFIGPVDPVELPAGELVVKPTVSAGSIDTSLYGPDETSDAAEHVRALQLEGRTAMVQPYRHMVDESAETGLVYLGATFLARDTQGADAARRAAHQAGRIPRAHDHGAIGGLRSSSRSPRRFWTRSPAAGTGSSTPASTSSPVRQVLSSSSSR